MVPTTYEESDNDEELKTVAVIDQNNNNDYNVISDSGSNDEVNKKLFDDDVNDE